MFHPTCERRPSTLSGIWTFRKEPGQLPTLRESRDRTRGFSLLEALLSLMILTLVVVSFLGLLTEVQEVVHVQAGVTGASEDLRFTLASVVRQVRMAGAGGLPTAGPGIDGMVRPLAIDVADNVQPVSRLNSSAGGGEWAFEAGRTPVGGTDVLRIRGVMTTPLFGLIGANFESPGRCLIPSVDPWTGLAQDLTHPGGTLGRPFLFALQSPMTLSSGDGHTRDVGQWRVVEISEEASIEDSGGAGLMSLRFDDGRRAAFASLNAAKAYSVRPAEVFSGGFLDDLVFLVSKNRFGGRSLYRLRITGGEGDRVRAEEVVPNVVDFQIALGCDLNADGRLEGREWFLSRDHAEGPTGEQMVALSQVRISIVTCTQRPDRRWSKAPESHENGKRITTDWAGFRYRSMTVRVTPRTARSCIGGTTQIRRTL